MQHLRGFPWITLASRHWYQFTMASVQCTLLWHYDFSAMRDLWLLSVAHVSVYFHFKRGWTRSRVGGAAASEVILVARLLLHCSVSLPCIEPVVCFSLERMKQTHKDTQSSIVQGMRPRFNGNTLQKVSSLQTRHSVLQSCLRGHQSFDLIKSNMQQWVKGGWWWTLMINKYHFHISHRTTFSRFVHLSSISFNLISTKGHQVFIFLTLRQKNNPHFLVHFVNKIHIYILYYIFCVFSVYIW